VSLSLSEYLAVECSRLSQGIRREAIIARMDVKPSGDDALVGVINDDVRQANLTLQMLPLLILAE
jgi:hypothetical protein